MMKPMSKSAARSPQKGFSLIEVMIAVVVLATGLLALTLLQASLTRSSADAKARSLLVAHAQAVMDAVRTQGSAKLTISPCVPASVSACVLPGRLAQVREAMGASSLTENSVVTTLAGSPSFRNVELRFTWVDATGASRSLRMGTAISPLLLSQSPLVDVAPPASGSYGPIVRRPTPVTDGMIPIALGNNEDTAATNPKPQLLGGASGTYVSDTAFDVLTYNTADNLGQSGFVRFDKRIETRVVGCTCQNSADGFDVNGQTSDFLAFQGLRAFRPTYWDGEKYAEPEVAAAGVTTSPADTSQSQLCEICCRDHKDPDGVAGPKFSPWSGQDPAHIVANDGTYLEACRVIRVNGVFRVAADPKVQDIALVPTRVFPAIDVAGSSLPGVSDNTAATSPSVDDSGVGAAENGTTAYVDYVFDFVKQVYHTGISTADPYAVDVAAIQQARGLNAPAYIPIRESADRRWMHSRALVTDFLEQQAIDRIVKAKASTGTGNPCLGSSDQDLARCVLPYSPIATVNITEIANWAARSATVADALPAPLGTLDLNYLNYAKPSLRRYNTGLALVGAINSGDSASPATDEQLFVRLSAAAPTTTPWLTTPNPNPTTARAFGNVTDPMRGYAQSSPPIPFFLSWDFPGGNPPSPVTTDIGDPTGTVVLGTDCSLPNTNNNNTNPHECDTTTAGSFVLELKGYTRTEIKNNVNNPCGPGKVTQPVCVVYTFTGATVDAPADTISASPYPLYSGTQGKKNEIIRITVPGVSDVSSSTVTVSFSRSEPATTYTCSGNTPVWTPPCE
ncbi:MAG TPA: prepilin-type N-terminal cleavage/methylation domain-containing protein [Lysobacter sp.]